MERVDSSNVDQLGPEGCVTHQSLGPAYLTLTAALAGRAFEAIAEAAADSVDDPAGFVGGPDRAA